MGTDSRSILRVFLASPNDVETIRRVARNVVDELNRTFSDQAGIQIDLLGWEDTPTGYGRPQALINAEVDRCDIMLGILYKRWGTPPDSESDYGSGFEEEFDRAINRRRETGTPDIQLVFKRVEDESDPGPQLSRVLAFKRQLIDAKELLFKEIDSDSEAEKHFRNILTHELLGRIPSSGGRSPPFGASYGRGEQDSSTEGSGAEPVAVPAQLVDTLAGVDSGLREASDLSSFSADADRFDLLRAHLAMETLVSRRVSHELLNVHALNALYLDKERLDAEEAELGLILRTLVAPDLIVSGWYWHGAKQPEFPAWLLGMAVFDDVESVRRGAYELLTKAGEPLVVDDRETFLSMMVEENEPSVQRALVSFLASRVSEEEVTALSGQEGVALTSSQMAELRGRVLEVNDSARFYSEQSSVEALHNWALEALGESIHSVDEPLLAEGLAAPDPRLRLLVAEELLGRGSLDETRARQLISEGSPPVLRAVGFKALAQAGELLDPAEVKLALNPPSAPTDPSTQGLLNLGGLLSISSRPLTSLSPKDVDDVLAEVYRSLPDEAVSADVEWLGGVPAYRVALERELITGDDARQGLANRFEGLRDSYFGHLETTFGQAAVDHSRPQLDQIENFVVSEFATEALLAISKLPKEGDADLARSYTFGEQPLVAAVQVLCQIGEDSDVPPLLELVDTVHGELRTQAIEACATLASLERLLGLISSGEPAVVCEALRMLAQREVLIEPSLLLTTLNSDDANVRRAGVGYLLASEPDGLEEWLRSYSSQDRYFYDVVRMLDCVLYAPSSVGDALRAELALD